MNSGIKNCKLEGNYYSFEGVSGSIYKCHKKSYGIRSPYSNSVLAGYKEKMKEGFEIFTKKPKILEIIWDIA